MPAQYSDIYIRDNFADGGVIPSSNNPYTSPDIIPYQQRTLDWVDAQKNYANGPDMGMPIVNPGQNNIYVRARNLGRTSSSGTAQLYVSPASLFLIPTNWTPVMLPSGAGTATLLDQSNSATIAANELCMGNPAFLLTGVATSEHYCFIAVIQTPANPVTVPASFPSNAALVQWVQNNPAVGWRNLTIVPNGQTQSISTLGFGSTDANPAYFHFKVLGRGYPTGTGVQVQSTDSRCPFTFTGSLPAPDVNGNQITGFDEQLPGMDAQGEPYQSQIVVTLTSPGGAFPSTATISVVCYEYPSANDELHRTVGRFAEIAPERDGRRMQHDAFLIEVGACNTIVAT